jgi:uncharacterized protein
MPNKNSKKKHIPVRTCVICKKKGEKENMLRFVLVNSSIIFDIQRKIWWHGNYCCSNLECIKMLRKKKKLYHKFKSWR